MDADARVDHVEPQSASFASVAAAEADDDRTLARLGELDGVAHQVDEDLPQAAGIGRDASRAAGRRIQLQAQVPCLLRARASARRHVGDQLPGEQATPLDVELAGLDLREVEDVVDQRAAGARRCGG